MDDLEPSYELSDTGYPVHEPVSYFAIQLREPNRIRLINVGPDVVRCIQERLEQLVPVEQFGYVIFNDYQTNFLGRFNVYDLILEKEYFNKDGNGATKEDMTIIKVAFSRIFGALFCFGYDVIVASDLCREVTHSTVFLKLRDPHDYVPLHYYSHKFICIAPYSTDSILLINIPKQAVEPILKVSETLGDVISNFELITEFALSGVEYVLATTRERCNRSVSRANP